MQQVLAVVLNAAVDTTLTIPGPLMVGETHKVRDVLKLPGGKGINVARVLHTLGVSVHVTGLAGGQAAEFIDVPGQADRAEGLMNGVGGGNVFTPPVMAGVKDFGLICRYRCIDTHRNPFKRGA